MRWGQDFQRRRIAGDFTSAIGDFNHIESGILQRRILQGIGGFRGPLDGLTVEEPLINEGLGSSGGDSKLMGSAQRDALQGRLPRNAWWLDDGFESRRRKGAGEVHPDKVEISVGQGLVGFTIKDSRLDGEAVVRSRFVGKETSTDGAGATGDSTGCLKQEHSIATLFPRNSELILASCLTGHRIVPSTIDHIGILSSHVPPNQVS